METHTEGGLPQEEGERRSDGDFYKGKWILAPMVRIGILPFRLECLKYGADLVYTEEIIDHKLLNTVRTFNEDFGTIEYIHRQDSACVFSTCEEERGRVVLQLGTCDSTRALRASQLVAQDVVGIDVNMGCPKSFSMKGGMGAALLKTPERATDILKTLRRNLSCPVTCKIRLLDTIPQTIDFARMCESCGIDALALHAREVHERPNHRAHWDAFPIVRSSLSIPFIANGDFLSADDAAVFQEKGGGADSLMFARGALWDPSIFLSKPQGASSCSYPSSFAANGLVVEGDSSKTSSPSHLANVCPSSSSGRKAAGDATSAGGGKGIEQPHPRHPPLLAGPPPRLALLRDYVKQSLICNAPYQAIKFTLQSMAVHRDDNRDLKLSITSSKSVRDLCQTLGIESFYASLSPALPPHANSLTYYQKQRKAPSPSLRPSTTTPTSEQFGVPYTGPSQSLKLKKFLRSDVPSTGFNGVARADSVDSGYVVEGGSAGGGSGTGESNRHAETAQSKLCTTCQVDARSHSRRSLSDAEDGGDDKQKEHGLPSDRKQEPGKGREKDGEEYRGDDYTSSSLTGFGQGRTAEIGSAGVKKRKVAEKEFPQNGKKAEADSS